MILVLLKAEVFLPPPLFRETPRSLHLLQSATPPSHAFDDAAPPTPYCPRQTLLARLEIKRY